MIHLILNKILKLLPPFKLGNIISSTETDTNMNIYILENWKFNHKLASFYYSHTKLERVSSQSDKISK